MATSEEHTEAAWLLRDVTHVPGVLRIGDGRLAFVSTRRVVFDATPGELALTASRTRRGRFHLVVDGERLALSVVRPPGAVPVPADLWTRVTGEATVRDEAAQDGARRRLAALCLLAPGGGPRRPRPRRGHRGFAHLTSLVRSSPADPA